MATAEPLPMKAIPAAAAATDDRYAVVKDVFAGAVGGMAQVLIGQPFDIVKVRLQTTSRDVVADGSHGNPPTALSTARQIYTHEGARAFYKGTLTPLLGIGACVSVQFGAFHATRRYLEGINARNSSSSTSASSTSTQLSLSQIYLAGAIAGLANTPLSAPIEHVRIRLQTQPHGSARLYAGPWDCVRKLASHGTGRGLYRGTAVTALREMTAYGMWFLTFESLMKWELERQQQQQRRPRTTSSAIAVDTFQRKDIPAWKVALFGGLAGEALWIASYPFDVIKSRLQTDGFTPRVGDVGTPSSISISKSSSTTTPPPPRRYAGALDCARHLWRTEGARGFWRGIGPTLARAMPVSAGTFAVVEGVRRAVE